ncbi:MAG: glutamine--fructose-6-phosphate transaminase (isomerizing), partial [Clostridia bacterium]|nr:glutamine--fructose-6-phosphate transaminase (isomerizing) [Clostridia bacterium]
MCGIVGYVGNKSSLPVLLEGLRMLEYRGYDSAGVSLAYERDMITVKSKGKLCELEKKLAERNIRESLCGIGHTRWATHGAPSDINSHPHETELLTLVHNGIIENHKSIEGFLLREGYSFVSETDTERAAKLIDYFYKQTREPISALLEAKKTLLGSFAFGVIFKDIPSKIYALRKDNPLIVGYDGSSSYLASDIPAILPYTKRCCRLSEGIVAELSSGSISFYDKPFSLVSESFEEVEWTCEQARKGGFPHFMLKEISEEPSALRSTVERRLDGMLPALFDIDDDIFESVEHISIVACGTAMHAGLVGRNMIEKYARIPVSVEIASEFRYRDLILQKGTLALFLSQSGETADTIAALRKAKELGYPTLAIVNVFGSTLAREADRVLYTDAGPEISVASTKAYSVQCAMLSLLALKLALLRGEMSEEKVKEICSSLLCELPSAVESVIARGEEIRALSMSITDAEHLFFIGRGIDYSLALEASLKLKEISYIHSEAYPSGELKHGIISLISDGTP